MLKRLLVYTLVMALIPNLSLKSFTPEVTINRITQERVASEEELLNEVMKTFEQMSTDELNRFIDEEVIKFSSSQKVGTGRGKRVIVNPIAIVEVKLAWLAAAQIAENMGYTCSAKLVKNSINNKDYSENVGVGGLFRDKIVQSAVYSDFISGLMNGNYQTDQGNLFTHTKEDNSDLFYSLHSCTYYASDNGSGYDIHVKDVFDFDLWSYDSPFTGVVNNFAWLCEHTFVLNRIDVDIYFDSI